MEEIKVMELPEKSEVEITDQFIIEDEDGTKLGNISSLKKIMINNLIFKNIEEMKSASLREGETCITLGYHTENDGGGAQYLIEYSPALVEDKATIHYLYTSDTLRAKFISDGTVSPEQFGAYGDGIRNDYTAIMKCINSGYYVRFNQAHRYRINTPIPVQSNTYLDFNGCTIIPNYCDGVAKTFSSNEAIVENVTIKNVTFEMEDGSNAINISHPVKNLNISGVNINGEKLYGIKLGSVYGGNITESAINSFENNSSSVGIGINSDVYTADPYTTINISEMMFSGLNPAITVNTVGNTLSLNIDHCKFTHATTVSSYKNILRCMGGTIRASVNSIDAINLDMLFILSTETYISLSDIFTSGCSSLIDNLSGTSVINIGKNIVLSNPAETAQAVVNRMYGKLINGNPNICVDDPQPMTSTSFVEYSGTLYDTSDPSTYDIEAVSDSSGTLRVTGINNRYFDITGSADITTIEGGINGQRILLKSSLNGGRSIIASDDIALNSGTVSIGNCSPLELKKVNGKWIQVR